jgi:chemotaxis regulatin CheY-phosphate phosphatase CheZ
MKQLAILLMVLLMLGCTALNKANEEVITGAAERAVFSIDYTQPEIETIKNAIAEYNRFHNRWQNFIVNPVVLLPNGREELAADFQDLRQRYMEIEHIIAVNFNRYDPFIQKQLLKYQKMAQDVNKDMQTIKTIGDVLTYGALVAQIAAKMLKPI